MWIVIGRRRGFRAPGRNRRVVKAKTRSADLQALRLSR
jgi:hypothetical protein